MGISSTFTDEIPRIPFLVQFTIPGEGFAELRDVDTYYAIKQHATYLAKAKAEFDKKQQKEAEKAAREAAKDAEKAARLGSLTKAPYFGSANHGGI
jgi:hypothetical protein